MLPKFFSTLTFEFISFYLIVGLFGVGINAGMSFEVEVP